MLPYIASRTPTSTLQMSWLTRPTASSLEENELKRMYLSSETLMLHYQPWSYIPKPATFFEFDWMQAVSLPDKFTHLLRSEQIFKKMSLATKKDWIIEWMFSYVNMWEKNRREMHPNSEEFFCFVQMRVSLHKNMVPCFLERTIFNVVYR